MVSPKISIIIPSYQQASFLEDCLRSVLSQDYPLTEVIVIDGGSTDGSADILRKYADRLAYWQSVADKGQADAVNMGWARATGDVLGWLNSDDRYAAGALAAVARAWESIPQAAMLYGDVNEIDANGALLKTKRMAGFGLDPLLLGKNMGQPGVFTTRLAYEQIGGLRTELHYALDFEYYLRIWSRFPAAQCVYVPRVLAESRLWEATKSASQADRFGAEYKKTLDDFFARNDLDANVRSLAPMAYNRSVRLRHARLCLDAGDFRKGFPSLVEAVWNEPAWREKFRIMGLGIRTFFGAKRKRI